MIVDLILDRKDADAIGIDNYNARDFYINILDYENIFNMPNDISLAMDYGDENAVKKAICKYIIDNDYNENICKYINSKNWIE